MANIFRGKHIAHLWHRTYKSLMTSKVKDNSSFSIDEQVNPASLLSITRYDYKNLK